MFGVGLDATQLGPWYPFIQPFVGAFVVDIDVTVGATTLEDLDELCREHNGEGMYELRDIYPRLNDGDARSTPFFLTRKASLPRCPEGPVSAM